MFGVVMALLGTLFGIVEMRERLHVDLAGQANMFLLLFVGIFAATAIAGPLIDSSGHKPVLAASSILVALAMAGLASVHSFRGSALFAVVLGLGGGGLNTATNAAVSDAYGERRGPMLNLLGIFYGIGALCIPLLAAVLAAHFSLIQLLWSCVCLAVLCAILFFAIAFPPPAASQEFSWQQAVTVARYRGVVLLAFLLFCQSGNEASIAGWTSTYASSMGIGSRAATLLLAEYWATLMCGRLLTASLLTRLEKTSLVLASAAGAVAGASLLLLAKSLPAMAVAVAVIGFSYAGIFPTVLAIAGDSHKKMAGTVFSLLFSVALLGGMLFPWAVGQLSWKMDTWHGMLMPLLGAVGISAIAYVLLQRGRIKRAIEIEN